MVSWLRSIERSTMLMDTWGSITADDAVLDGEGQRSSRILIRSYQTQDRRLHLQRHPLQSGTSDGKAATPNASKSFEFIH